MCCLYARIQVDLLLPLSRVAVLRVTANVSSQSPALLRNSKTSALEFDLLGEKKLFVLLRAQITCVVLLDVPSIIQAIK